MSVKVDLEQLAAKVDEYGFAYLVTVASDGHAHVLSVWPEATADGLVVDGVGRHSQDNAADRADVTLVWPPAAPDGYSLLVDGTGEGRRLDDHRRPVQGDPPPPGRRPRRPARRQRLRRHRLSAPKSGRDSHHPAIWAGISPGAGEDPAQI